MPSSTRKVVINKGYEGDEPITETPMHLKEVRSLTRENQIDQVNIMADDPWNYNDTIPEKSDPEKKSNRLYLALVIITCLISVVVILLNLLMLFGKIGERCSCSSNTG